MDWRIGVVSSLLLACALFLAACGCNDKKCLPRLEVVVDMERLPEDVELVFWADDKKLDCSDNEESDCRNSGNYALDYYHIDVHVEQLVVEVLDADGEQIDRYEATPEYTDESNATSCGCEDVNAAHVTIP